MFSKFIVKNTCAFLLCVLSFNAYSVDSAKESWLSRQDGSQLVLRLVAANGGTDVPSKSQLKSLNQQFSSQRIIYTKRKTKQGNTHYFYLGPFKQSSQAIAARNAATEFWPRGKFYRLKDVLKLAEGKIRVFDLSGSDKKVETIVRPLAPQAMEPEPAVTTAAPVFARPKPKAETITSSVYKSADTDKATPKVRTSTVSTPWRVKLGLGMAQLSDRGVKAALQQRGYNATVDFSTTVFSYQLSGGYQFTDRLSLNVGLVTTEGVDDSLTVQSTNNLAALAQDYQNLAPYGFSAYTLSMRYLAPISDAWTLGGELGAAAWDTEREALAPAGSGVLAPAKSYSGSGALVGVAAEYQLNENWLLGLDLQQFLLDEDALLATVSLGFEW